MSNSATNRWVTQSDGDLYSDCWLLARILKIRGWPGALFQVQDQIPDSLTYRMITVIVPDGSTVDGEPGGKVFMIGEPALQHADSRHETSIVIAKVMDDAKAK